MTKILISSGIENIIPLGRTFKELGYHVKVFDYNLITSPLDEYIFKPANNVMRSLKISRDKPVGRNSRFRSDRYKAAKLKELIKDFRPEIFLAERGIALPEEFLKEIKREYGVKTTIAWWTKGLQWLDLALKDARLYDYYFFIHRSFVAECNDRGLKNCFYLPYTADNELFNKIELSDKDMKEYNCEVVFVGGWYPNRQEIIKQVIMDSGYDIRIWGPKWKRKNLGNTKIYRAVRGAGIYGKDLVKQYIAARINLNISKWIGETNNSGLNLRVFEIPRCGGFLLTDHIDELGEFYVIGKEIETYSTIEELKDKIAFYLKNDSAREGIARKGHEKALRMPGWKERIKEMMGLIP